MNRARAFSLAVAVGITLLGAWSAATLRVHGEMGAFLPEGDPELAVVSRALVDSPLARTWLFAVRGGDERARSEAAALLGEALRRLPDMEMVRGGVSEEEQRAFFELYFPRRFGLAEPLPGRAPGEGPEEALSRRAQAAKAALGGPQGTLVRRVFREDPLLQFPRFLDSVRGAGADSMQMGASTFVSADGSSVLVVARSKHGPLDGEANARVVPAVERAVRGVVSQFRGVTVEQSAVHRHAAASERAIRADMTRISVGSTVGMLLIFWLAFRSLRPLLLSVVPMAVGVALAFTVTAACFPAVHGITLAFGAALTGVCVDYAVHWLLHQSAAHGRDKASRRVAQVAIVVGALTTALGVAGLAWTSFPGMREIALFSVVGIAASVAFSFWFVPLWVDGAELDRTLAAPEAWTRAALRRLAARRGAVGLLLGVLVLPLAAAPWLGWADSMAALVRRDAALEAEDARVRELAGRHDASRLVVARGATTEAALRTAEQVEAALAGGAEQGGRPAFARSLAALLPSAERQAARIADLRALAPWDGAWESALAQEGFVGGATLPLSALSALARPPLALEDLMAAGLGEWARPFLLAEAQGSVLLGVYLRGGPGEAEVVRRLAPLGERAFHFDQTSYLARAYRAFRTSVLELLAAGFALIALVIGVRYRSVRLTAVALLPAALSVGVFFGALALLGAEANLMHLLGGLLVLSMGEDYGVFVAEHIHSTLVGTERTVLGILLASATTALSFGFLAFSPEPALAALGSTVACALPLAAVFALGALVILAPHETSGASAGVAEGPAPGAAP